mgnify:CR=1 FL=1
MIVNGIGGICMVKFNQVKQFILKSGYSARVLKTERDAIRLVEDVNEEHFNGDNWEQLFNEFTRQFDSYMKHLNEMDRY